MLLLSIHQKASSHPERTPAVEKQTYVSPSPHCGSVCLVPGVSPGREKLGLPRVVTYTMTGREKGTKAAGGRGTHKSVSLLQVYVLGEMMLSGGCLAAASLASTH